MNEKLINEWLIKWMKNKIFLFKRLRLKIHLSF